MNSHQKGFTLIELLVVIAILSILATLIIPEIAKGRENAKLLKCVNNLRSLYASLINYESEFKGYPPYKGTKFWEALRTLPTPASAILQKQDELFICPLKNDQPGIGVCNYRGPQYEANDSVNGATPLGADISKNHDSRNGQKPINVLYWGGKITKGVTYGSADWQEVDENLQE